VKVLFDVNVPRPLRRHLPGHQVTTSQERGWAELRNGDLLAAAGADFDVLLTSRPKPEVSAEHGRKKHCHHRAAHELHAGCSGVGPTNPSGLGQDQARRLRGSPCTQLTRQKQ
jgi:hypothetical protein